MTINTDQYLRCIATSLGAMQKSSWRFFIIFNILLGNAAVSTPTLGAELLSAQSGSITFASSSENVAINSVVDSKAFLLFTLESASPSTDGPDETHVIGQLNCSSGTCNSIDFERYSSGSASVNIDWHVLEYKSTSAVSVQRGIEDHNTFIGDHPANKTISTNVDPSHSFVLLSDFVQGTVTSDDDFSRGRLDSSGNLELSVYEKKTSVGQGKIAWQVIQYDDANVTSGDLNFGLSDSLKTASVSISDLEKTWMVYNYRTTGKGSDSSNPVGNGVRSIFRPKGAGSL